MEQGKTYSVFITDVNFNLGKDLTIWAQVGDAIENTLNNITATLDDESSDVKLLTSISHGSLCACKYSEDQQWYRASIVKQTTCGKWIAQFIDYGNSQILNENEIFQLSKRLMQIPPLATALFLHESICPLQSAHLWTSEVVQVLLDLLLYNEVEVFISRVSEEKIHINCKMITDILVSKGLAEIQSSIVHPFSSFPIGEDFAGYVSCALSCGILFIQKESSNSALAELSSQMANYLPGLSTLSPENIKPGCLVAALYNLDQNFYRAQVLSVDENICTVMYIDYGNEEQQDFSSIFPLPKRVSSLPYQAIPCELHDINIFPHKHSPNLKKCLMDKVGGQHVRIKVINHVFKLGSNVSVNVHFQEENLSAMLVAKSFAKLRRCNFDLFECNYERVDEGSQHTAFISHVEPNGIFYVSKMSEAAKLDKLTDDLTEYCSKANMLTQITPGMCCCAFYDQDNTWYRALVRSVEGDECVVWFVDYGNMSTCKISCLKPISKQSMDLNCQAIECKILRELTIDEIKLLQKKCGEMVEVKFLKKADVINSYHVKVVQDKKVLFPPLGQQSARKFKTLKIDIENTEKITVLSFDSPEDMWGRLVSNEKTVQELCNDLNKTFESNDSGKFKTKDKIEVGTACIVHDLQYKQWCRGEVFKKQPNDVYSVLLIDVGIIKDYPTAQLASGILDHFFDLPAQAVHFSLAKFTSVDIETLKMIDLSSFFLDNVFTAKFVSYNESNNIYQVEFFDDIGLPIETVLTEMVKNPTSKKQVFGTSIEAHKHLTKLQFVPIDGISVEVSVCSVEDPDCMWLQLQSNSRILFQLLEDMKAFYMKLPSNVLDFQEPHYDALCAVNFKNKSLDNWYRGRILCMYGDVIEVKLIDFGNEVKVKQKNIKRLSSNFSQFEPQSIKCKLFNVLPSSKKWTNVAVHELARLANESSTVYATFIEKQKSCYVVDLELNLKNETIKVNEFLVNKNIAVWQDESVVVSKTTKDTDIVSTNSDADCEPTLSTKCPKIFYRSPGVAFIGAEVEVFASQVTSPDDFFLQINDACHRQMYSTLIRDLNTACTLNVKPLFVDRLYVGQPCAVFYDRVQQWCRGAILNYADLENVQICLVDFGSIALYPLNEVKSIDPQLVLKAPPEAMRCTLQGIVKPKLNSWSADAITLCKEFFESDQGNLVCTVHACAANKLCSYFICSVRTPLRNLADELIKAELGVKTTTIGKVCLPLTLKSFIYSNLGQVKGKEDVYIVVHIETPNLFYCQLSNNFSSIDLMMDKLQMHCNSEAGKSATLDEIIQDCMCFAKISNRWHRAHFVASGSNNMVKVLLVDYGSTAFVPINDVQKFSDDAFYELPIQALPCSLKDLDANFTTLEHQKLLSIEMNNKLFQKEFDGVVIGSTNGKLHLDLFHEGKRINDIIVKNTTLETNTPSTEENIELYNSSERDCVFKLFEPKELIAGKTFCVTAATCVNPNSFYLWLNLLEEQRIYRTSAIDGMYTAMRNADYKLKEIFPGDIVCARRSKDMKWCRAKVTGLTETDVEVFYVDSGETDTVLRAYDVKQLMSKIGDFSIMAIPCFISDVNAHEIKWSSQAILEFQYFVRNSQLTAEFVSKHASSEKWLVKLMRDGVDFISHLKNIDVVLCDNYLDQQKNVDEKFEIDVAYVWEGEKQVFISHVVSETEIFIQDINSFSAIRDLGNRINKDEHLYNFKATPDVNSFCLARYTKDNQIYRAQILSCNDMSSFLVKFVDFGNTAKASFTDLFVMSEKYASLPQTSVYCKVNVFGNLTAEEVVLKLNELSASDNINVFASFTQNDSGDVNLVEMRVQPKHEVSPVSLNSFFSALKDSINSLEELKCSVSEADVYGLQYPVMESVLNQPHRSIYVSHVENPGHVFCQLSEFYDELDILMNNIDSYYKIENAEDSIETTESISLGSPCVAKYQIDNAWYRAVVENIVDSNRLAVCFVDYGNSQSVSVTDIRKLKIEFCALPPQAVQCFVAEVNHKFDAWSSEQIREFDDRVATLQLEATFTKLVDGNLNIFEVILSLPDGTLLSNDYKTCEALEDSSPLLVPEGAVDNQDIMPGIDLSNQSVPKKLTEAPERHVLKQRNLKKGSMKNCFISYAECMEIFYLQIAGTENDLNSLYELASKDAQRDTFAELNYNEVFEMNTFCVAKSPEYGEWYRGKIVKVEDKPTVFFIDFGNCAVLDWSFVKPMSKDTAVLPIQSIPCTFGSRFKLEKELEDEAIELFFKLVEGLSLTVCFLNRAGSTWEVSIMAKGIDVAEKIMTDLCQKHPYLAEKVNEDNVNDVDVSKAPSSYLEPLKHQMKCNTTDECLLYCEKVFEHCRNLLVDFSFSENLFNLVNEAFNTISTFNKTHKIGINDLNSDDHKRPLSELLSTSAPCKKPKLDEELPHSVANLNHPQEKDKNKLEAFTILPSTSSHALIFSVDSPDRFLVMPEFATISLFGISVSELLPLENIENHIFCAFCTGNDTAVKRGYVLKVLDTEVTVIDIDLRLKRNVQANCVFAYPSLWHSQKPPVVSCSLFGVVPVENEWSPEACSFFRKFIEDSHKAVSVEFIEQTSTESSLLKWLVDVVVDDYRVSQLMVENQFAVKAVENVTDDSPTALLVCASECISVLTDSEQAVTSKAVEDTDENLSSSHAVVTDDFDYKLKPSNPTTKQQTSETSAAAIDSETTANRAKERVPKFAIPMLAKEDGDIDDAEDIDCKIIQVENCSQRSAKESIDVEDSEDKDGLVVQVESRETSQRSGSNCSDVEDRRSEKVSLKTAEISNQPSSEDLHSEALDLDAKQVELPVHIDDETRHPSFVNLASVGSHSRDATVATLPEGGHSNKETEEFSAPLGSEPDENKTQDCFLSSRAVSGKDEKPFSEEESADAVRQEVKEVDDIVVKDKSVEFGEVEEEVYEGNKFVEEMKERNADVVKVDNLDDYELLLPVVVEQPEMESPVKTDSIAQETSCIKSKDFHIPTAKLEESAEVNDCDHAYSDSDESDRTLGASSECDTEIDVEKISVHSSDAVETFEEGKEPADDEQQTDEPCPDKASLAVNSQAIENSLSVLTDRPLFDCSVQPADDVALSVLDSTRIGEEGGDVAMTLSCNTSLDQEFYTPEISIVADESCYVDSCFQQDCDSCVDFKQNPNSHADPKEDCDSFVECKQDLDSIGDPKQNSHSSVTPELKDCDFYVDAKQDFESCNVDPKLCPDSLDNSEQDFESFSTVSL